MARRAPSDVAVCANTPRADAAPRRPALNGVTPPGAALLMVSVTGTAEDAVGSVSSSE
jgi:hypothetical protein